VGQLLMRTAIGLGVLALILFGALWLLTSLVIHFTPNHHRLTSAEFDHIAAEAGGEIDKVHLASSDGVRTVAWYLPARAALGSERWGVILTHGGGDSKTFYLPLAEQLRADGFDVMLPDLRGHGESAPSPKGVTLGITEGRDVAANAAFLADRKGVRHIAAGGVSMGGVATVMGAAQDQRIGPLIIESSSHQAQTVFDFILANFRVPPGGTRWGMARAITSFGLWRMGADWPDVRQGVLPTWRLARSLAPRPVIFLFGDKDPFVNEAAVRVFAARFSGRSEIVIFKDTGHGVYPKHPQQFTNDVLGFLNAWRAGQSA